MAAVPGIPMLQRLNFIRNTIKLYRKPFIKALPMRLTHNNNLFSHTFIRLLSTTTSAENSKSLCRVNFHEECEKAINKQINLELYNAYFYMALACFFERDSEHLPGFHLYFKKCGDDELDHADKLLRYMSKRGGKVQFFDIKKPPQTEWASGVDAMQAALALEKETYSSILDLHKLANDHYDPSLLALLDHDYIPEQVHAIRELSGYISSLIRVGPGLGTYKFDKATLLKGIQPSQPSHDEVF